MGVILNPFTGRLQPKSTGGGGGGTVTSVSGVTNRITVTNPTTTPTVDIASTYVGQSSITTVGTISTGVWNATAIGANFGGTGLTSYAVGAILRATGTATLAGLAPSAKFGSVLKSQGTGLSPVYSASAFNDAPPTDNRFLKSLSNDWVASTYSMPASLSPNRLIISNGSGDMSTFAMTNDTYLTYQTGFVSDTTNLRITASGLQVIGDLTGTPPPVSYRGEQISSFIPQASEITLSTGVAQNITSINLTAGVWDISCLCLFRGSLTGLQLVSAISTTSASLTGAVFGDSATATPNMPTASSQQMLSIPQFRVVLSSTTTYYLIAQATFSAGTATAYGRLSAVRVG